MTDSRSDLVLEGGGVKGIGLVGAALRLAEDGYTFPRVAGTSAGAIVGSVLAALQRRGESFDRLAEITRTLDYARFRDRGPVGRALGPLGFLTDGFSLLLENGVFEGDYLHDWLSGVLADLGVRTFGDLRTDDPGDDGTLHHRYSLVVTASDVSRQRFVRFPWDYADYGLDPDEQPVAEAVRASASIPFFFEPVELDGRHGKATLVDGGLLSNYPITIFDRQDERRPRWPTIGVRLSSLGRQRAEPRPVPGPVSLALAVVETAIEGSQAVQTLDPCNVARSVLVDTGDVGTIDFDLGEEDQERLLAMGRRAAGDFLAEWDFARWLRRCRGVSGGTRGAAQGAAR
ncbi:MAG: patatin-like phospholipase family protein [Actinomycetota bacterium]|nr:patatin-like phospholipase family protein [Actinomycetota bacterium]